MTAPHATAPRVSVVIPTYNAAGYLIETLASVAAQTFVDYEVLVCDDGSTDDTPAVAESALRSLGVARWRVVRVNRRGAAGSRNAGIAAATGDLVAFLDDDDHWTADKLARSVAAMDAERLDLLCHSERWRDEDGSERVRHYSPLFDRSVPPVVSLMRNNPFSTSAVVVRRARLTEAGPFDETLPSAEDYDLWIRLALLPGIRIGFLDEPLGTYLVRSGSESSKIDRRLTALLAIGERYATPLAAAARWGALERWRYQAKTYFTSGLRFAQQGSVARGARLALLGFAMWPFRFDLVRHALRERVRRVAT
jgi:glycosyltransferase involved in cell wall biosynthesis